MPDKQVSQHSQDNTEPDPISPEQWLKDWEQAHGRPLKILHYGNIANNSYNNAKVQRAQGIEADVVAPNYYHVMGCPEWEDAEITGDIANAFYPDFWAVDLNGFERPKWFVQGPSHLCRDYLLHKENGNKTRQWLAWRSLQTYRYLLVKENVQKLRTKTATPRANTRKIIHKIRTSSPKQMIEEVTNLPSRVARNLSSKNSFSDVTLPKQAIRQTAHMIRVFPENVAYGVVKTASLSKILGQKLVYNVVNQPKILAVKFVGRSKSGLKSLLLLSWPVVKKVTYRIHAPTGERLTHKLQSLKQGQAKKTEARQIAQNEENRKKNEKAAARQTAKNEKLKVLQVSKNERNKEKNEKAAARQITKNEKLKARQITKNKENKEKNEKAAARQITKNEKLKVQAELIKDRDVSVSQELYEEELDDIGLLNKEDFCKKYDILEEDYIPFIVTAQFWLPLFEHYDIIQAYSTDPIWPFLNQMRNYVAYEHGTIREIPFQDDPVGRLSKRAYLAAPAVFITNVDNIKAADRMGLTEKQRFYLPHAFDCRKLIRYREKCGITYDFNAPKQIFMPSRQHWVDGDPNWAKGNDNVIHAARLLKDQGLSPAIKFIEWGEDVEASKKLIAKLDVEDLFTWSPMLNKQQLWEQYLVSTAVIDQFLLPGISGVSFEAMTLGVPVITHDEGDLNERFFGKAPPLQTASNPQQVADQIARLMQEDGRRNKVGDTGTQWVLGYHGPERIFNIQADAFKQVLTKLEEA